MSWAAKNRWKVFRWLLVTSVLCLAIAPTLPLVSSALGDSSTQPVWTAAFRKSLTSTLWIGAGVSILSLLMGLPLGLLAALYRFPGRRPLILLQALPLLLPSFLLCIGWSNLAGVKWVPIPSGISGCVLVLGLQAVPLSFFATWAACQNLTASQIDAARLSGGERSVLWFSARACAPVAILSALLGGIISLSESGAPLIFGCRSASVEILTSFAAFFDYELAGRQCLLLAAVVLALTAPILFGGLRSIAAAVLAKQTRPVVPYARHWLRWVTPVGLLLVLLIGIGIPIYGLCVPAFGNPMIERAVSKFVDTAGTTMMFSGGAGVVAVLLATGIALAVTTDARLRLIVLAVLLMLLAMPPALAAIGVSQIGTHAPPQFDSVLRSDLTVPLVLGLRFLPVATVAMLRASGSLAPTWSDAARIHGVTLPRMFFFVTLPHLRAAIIVSLMLVMVLAAGDITTTHLLQPPGSQSLPVAIFTVMANSPEGLVATLCLLYLVFVVLLLAFASLLTPWVFRRTS